MRRQPKGVPAGGEFAAEARQESDVALEGSGRPPGDWDERTSPTGMITYSRSFAVADGEAAHSVSPAVEPRRDGESIEIGSGSIVISQRGRLPGEMTYRIVIAPMEDRTVKAIHINWVEVQRNRGKGWASAMYEAVREAHPDAIIPAAAALEAPGRKLVRRYRDKHPDVHTGRFDSQGRIHATRGGDDPLYRAGILSRTPLT